VRILNFCGLLCAAILAVQFNVAPIQAATYNAGAALLANEKPDGNATELVNPNPKQSGVWTYGYRTTVAGVALTPFVAAEHTNAFAGAANEPMEGWNVANAASVPLVLVNTDPNPFTLSFGAGPIAPGDMMLHGNNGQFAVVRFTVPVSGNYNGNSFFTAAHGGDVDVHVVVGGSSIFDAVLNPGQTTGPLIQTNTFLPAGTPVDFVVGINGTLGGDSTAFNATISNVPEPSSVMLLGVGMAAMVFYRRRTLRRAA
jgi:hypothetical protein